MKVGSNVYHRSLNRLVPLEVDTSETLPTPSEEVDDVLPQLQPPEPVATGRPHRKAAVDCNAKRKGQDSLRILCKIYCHLKTNSI